MGSSSLGGEFIELYNPTGGDLTIGAGWTLQRSDCEGATGMIYTFLAPIDEVWLPGSITSSAGKDYSGSVPADRCMQ